MYRLCLCISMAMLMGWGVCQAEILIPVPSSSNAASSPNTELTPAIMAWEGLIQLSLYQIDQEKIAVVIASNNGQVNAKTPSADSWIQQLTTSREVLTRLLQDSQKNRSTLALKSDVLGRQIELESVPTTSMQAQVDHVCSRAKFLRLRYTQAMEAPISTHNVKKKLKLTPH